MQFTPGELLYLLSPDLSAIWRICVKNNKMHLLRYAGGGVYYQYRCYRITVLWIAFQSSTVLPLPLVMMQRKRFICIHEC